MIIRLGGLDLNPSMNWSDRFQSYQVAQTVSRTVGGRSVVFSSPLQAGRKITLESTQEQGWLTLAMVEDLMVMSSITGSSFLFECGDETGTPEAINVIFRHNEPPALEISPIINRPVHETTDMFFGKIKLLTL